MAQLNIAILAGSLRAESYSRKIAKQIAAGMPEDAEAKLVELSDLEMFNQDYDDDGRPPASWQRFRREIAEADGIIFVAPEYNRSFPAVLKNAIDIASRPHGENLWNGKPCTIVGVTPGKTFAITGAFHLRQPLGFLGVLPLGEPQVFIPDVAATMGENGTVVSPYHIDLLKELADAFVDWIRSCKRA
ncbi:MAG: NAD(P)H-dependent oxidoreductase [Clostridiales Family XIII bacterium]|nr:NAD(P)H-dependent oxidoreductase [Clostridiales Family XIII bacterium]